MNFILAYASRARPHLFQKRITNWTERASGLHSLEWRCAFDVDDPCMHDQEMFRWCVENRVRYCLGHHRGKIEAINATIAGLDLSHADIIIIVSDDMAVRQGGWDAVVAADMLEAFPDLNGGLWYPDGIQNQTCTLSIMGRPVYEDLGYLYCPEYKTAFCDNDYHEILTASGRLKHIAKPLFRHEWRKENNDDLMARNEGKDLYAHDKAVFERRLPEIRAGRLLR